MLGLIESALTSVGFDILVPIPNTRTNTTDFRINAGLSTISAQIDGYMQSKNLIMPSSVLVVTDSGRRAAPALRNMLNVNAVQALDEFSWNGSDPAGAAGMTGSFGSSLQVGLSTPPTPDGFEHIGTLAISGSFTDAFINEYMSGYDQPMVPDNDDIERDPDVIYHDVSGKNGGRWLQAQQHRRNNLTGVQFARAGGMDKGSDAVEYLMQLSQNAAVARVKSSNVLQFDVYQNVETGVRNFVATRANYELRPDGLLNVSRSPVYTNLPLYQAVVSPPAPRRR